MNILSIIFLYFILFSNIIIIKIWSKAEIILTGVLILYLYLDNKYKNIEDMN